MTRLNYTSESIERSYLDMLAEMESADFSEDTPDPEIMAICGDYEINGRALA